MAVGGSEHLDAVPPGPALGLQLFAGIQGKAATALAGGLPGVAAGPNALKPPQRPVATAQQQGATLLGGRGPQHRLQIGQGAGIEANQIWRL